jgi:hypothetical protein
VFADVVFFGTMAVCAVVTVVLIWVIHDLRVERRAERERFAPYWFADADQPKNTSASA